MNRYPLWKNLIIALALAVGALYALPNLFGNIPAVQVSPLRALFKVDAKLTADVEAALKEAGITAGAYEQTENALTMRFPDVDTQKRARDVIEKKVGQGYSVALNLTSNTPHWMQAIHAKPMSLGLDLQGGVHFLLQVDMPKAIDKAVDRYVGDLRTAMRDKKIYYSGLAKEGQRVVIRFREREARAAAEKEIESNFRDLLVREEDSGEEFRVIATIRPEALKTTQDLALAQNIQTLRNRVNELGVAEPIVQQQGADRIVVQLPGVQDTAKAKDIIGRTATLEIRLVDDEKNALEAQQSGQAPFGTELYVERRGSPILVKKQNVLTGDSITDASPGFDQRDGRPAVHVTLDGKGGRIFKDVTRENIKKRMAILLVEKEKREVITAPVIQEELGSRFQITGMESTQEAKDVALLLRAGSLAAPMEIIEERTVGPSLGKENIDKGFNSVLYGFLAIAAFMIVYYMLFGVISVMALAANLLFLIALLSMLQATLTLPGIAAIALTLGMAIDANVLINERVREEIRGGANPQVAIKEGYERAWGTILDSNITTLIAGVALLIWGSGPVRGFAIVHCLGILTSIFSAVMVSRAIVNWVYGRKKVQKLSIGDTSWEQRQAAKA